MPWPAHFVLVRIAMASALVIAFGSCFFEGRADEFEASMSVIDYSFRVILRPDAEENLTTPGRRMAPMGVIVVYSASQQATELLLTPMRAIISQHPWVVNVFYRCFVSDKI